MEIESTFLLRSDSDVMVHFIRHKQTHIPLEFESVDGAFLEASEGVEGCEGMTLEG